MESTRIAAEKAVANVGSNVLIQASAGTGKTYNLVQRVLAILREDRVPIDQVLVLTFTEAAAAEMQTRIYSGIKEAEKTAVDPSEKAFFAQQKLRFGRHRIGTIHSFAGWVIRQSGDEVTSLVEPPVPYGYEVPSRLEGADGAAWTSSYEQIDDYMSALLATQWRHDFIVAHLGLGVVSALLEQAGSMGRLFEQLERATKLSDDALRKAAQMDGQALVAITSQYVKALETEMEAPFGRLTQTARAQAEFLNAPFPSTWKAFQDAGSYWYTGGKKLSRSRIVKMPHHPNESTEREAIAKKFDKDVAQLVHLFELEEMHRHMVMAIVDGKHDPEAPSGTLDAVIFAKMKSVAEVALRWKQYHRWRRAKDGLMSFDDLIDICHRLVGSMGTVRARLQTRFKHILVDEFQDTDARQWEIVQAIHGDGSQSKLFLVGDMKQAIYGFRGGNVSLIRNVEDHAIESPDQMQLATITVSRRSSKEIIDYVNGLFSAVMLPVGHERAFQATYMPLDPLLDRTSGDPNPGVGSVRYWSYTSEEALKAFGDRAEDRRIVDFVGQGRQVIDAYQLAYFIAQLRDDTEGTRYPQYRNVGEKLRNGEKAIGILLRNQSNVDHLTTAFRLFGIQSTVRAGSGFFERQEVSDLYYLVRFLDDAWDDMALAAVLRSPFFAVSDLGLLSVANAVKQRPRRSSWWVVLSESLDDLKLTELDSMLLRHAVALLKAWRNDVRGKRVSEVLARTLVQTPFLVGQPDVTMATENVHKLLDLLRGLEDRGSAHIGQISNWLRQQMENTSTTDAVVPGSSSIEITTMHRSKGLQYPMVILSNVVASGQANSGMQISPIDTHDSHTPLLVWRTDDDVENAGGDDKSFLYEYTKRQLDERERAEALRLLYVALTRAESHIVISDPHALGSRSTPVRDLLNHHAETLVDQGSPTWFTHEKLGKEAYHQLLDALMARVSGATPTAEPSSEYPIALSSNLEMANQRATAVLARPSDHERGGFSEWMDESASWEVLSPQDAGTLIHMMLEWPELDDSVLDHRLRLELEGLDYLHMDRLGVDIQRLKKHAQHARTYLGHHFRDARQYIREMPFEAWLGGDSGGRDVWLRGTIDLLVEDSSGHWHLIDFKTATVSEATLKSNALSNRYDSQLVDYCDALRAISGGAIDIPPERAILLFTAFEEGRPLSLAEL